MQLGGRPSAASAPDDGWRSEHRLARGVPADLHRALAPEREEAGRDQTRSAVAPLRAHRCTGGRGASHWRGVLRGRRFRSGGLLLAPLTLGASRVPQSDSYGKATPACSAMLRANSGAVFARPATSSWNARGGFRSALACSWTSST